MSFVHLHVHSHFSLLDGLPKIQELVAHAKALGMPALALTDHGALYGIIEFYQEANAAGINPILGMETYVAPHALHKKRPKFDDKPYHLTLLAATNEGYRNLLELASIAQIDGFYHKPRIDKNALARFHSGLIVLSGCLGGEVARLLKNNQKNEAYACANAYAEIMGPGNYYIELQRNPCTKAEDQKEQERVNQGLVTLSSELKLPLVATADSHYLAPAGREAQDILVCIGTGVTVSDDKRLDMRGHDLSFPDAEEMRKRFHDLPEAVENTLAIAERCKVVLNLGKWYFPHFPIPKKMTADDYLTETANAGLASRLKKVSKDAADRLAYELGIIKKKGYSTYFLVVADFVRFTREHGIITTTRGSAAGSLVAFSLGITTLNPLDYQLPFERFLNPERPSPPDIDVDLADTRRDEVIEYVTEKYGRDRVARICTFGTLLARAAVRDVSRALGHPYSFGDRIAKLIPLGSQGMPMTIKKAKKLEPGLVSLAMENADVRHVLELAETIEGNVRHASVHAAGVVVAPSRLTDFVPLQREHGSGIITQFDMQACEAVGLLKIDFLGIRNLSIIGEAIRIIKATTGVLIDLDHLPFDDHPTYATLARGETIGLFQLGGTGMTRYLKELKPTNLFDIMAMISLFRPGPMESIPEYVRRKHNPSLITYLHPSLKPILERSLGILVFQDDVLMIAVEIAGYTWAEADKLRKAMGKKIPKEMQMQKEKFLAGCVKHGKWDEASAEVLWRLIEPFAAYGFGKAHAASYAIIAYQTGYLKAHYPAQFMAAVMTAESGNLETIAEAVIECRKLGIEILPPDINESRENFTYISDTAVRFGLGAIKNLGSDMIASSIREREARGPFVTLTDFLTRLPQETVNKKSLESLIKTGALDRFGERNQLLINIDRILEFVRHRSGGGNEQQNLFGTRLKDPVLTLVPSPILTSPQKLAWEKELLGLYVSAHPFREMAAVIRSTLPSLASIQEHMADGAMVTLVGIIAAIKEIRTKKGDRMAFVTLEDETGTGEVVVFPRLFQEAKEVWVQDTVILIKGKIDDGDRDKKIIANSAIKTAPDQMQSLLKSSPAPRPANIPSTDFPDDDGEKPITSIPLSPTRHMPPEVRGKIIIALKKLTTSMQMDLKILFEQNPGNMRVFFSVPAQGSNRAIETNFAIRYDEQVREKIEAICGQGSVSHTQ